MLQGLQKRSLMIWQNMPSCNPLGVEEGVSGVGSEGPRKTGTSRAVCAGVTVHVRLKDSRPDVSVCSFSPTRKNTAGSANARGPGVTRGVPPAQASNSTLRRGFRCGSGDLPVPPPEGIQDRPSMHGGASLDHLPVRATESRRAPARDSARGLMRPAAEGEGRLDTRPDR